MALLTLFPLAALVSKYGILQETKKTQTHITVYIHRTKTKYMINAIYLEITQMLLMRLHSRKTLSRQ